MSDMFSDEDQPEQPAAPAPTSDRDAAYWRAEAEKAFSARDQARQDLRTKIESGYAPEVVELVPKNLPPKEWEDFANKLVAFRGEAPATPETSSEEPPPEVDVPEETLAGIVRGPSGSASGGTGEVSRSDWLDLVRTNPAEAERLFKSDKVNFSDLREGLGPDS